MPPLLLLLLAGGLFFFFTGAPRLVDRRLNTVAPAPDAPVSEAASQLHQRLLVADLHADFLLWSRDLLTRSAWGHVDLPRLVEGNVALQTFSVVTQTPWRLNFEYNEDTSDSILPLAVAQRWPPTTWRNLAARALYQARRLHEAAARSGGQLTVITSTRVLEQFLAARALDRRRVAGLLAIEGLHALEEKLENVDVFFEAGFRMMSPTHMFDTAVAGSAHGAKKGGLTAFGRTVIRRMEDFGILVDLAHASPRAIDDVLALATRPVLVSHTGVQSTCPGPRNLSDDQIRRIAATDGLIGIGFFDGAVCTISPQAIVRAIRHVANLVGVEHAALGSDFDGTVRTPFDAAGLVRLTEALLEAGFDEDEIHQIMGGNVFRLLRRTLPPA